MENKKVSILLVLVVILVILVIVCNQKYKPSDKVNTYNKNDDITETEQKEEEKPLTMEEKELINKLYNKVTINNAKTECLDYYLNDKITIADISDDLKSFLLIKNMNLVKSEEAQPISNEKVQNTLKELFNMTEEENKSYVANVGLNRFSINYDIDFSTYVVSSSDADSYNNTLEREIVNRTINDNDVKIEESFKLNVEGATTIEGKIIYTFNKVDNNYYFAGTERILNK